MGPCFFMHKFTMFYGNCMTKYDSESVKKEPKKTKINNFYYGISEGIVD